MIIWDHCSENGPKECFLRFSIFRSLKCPLHSNSYALRNALSHKGTELLN